jgi:hypothetical protein
MAAPHYPTRFRYNSGLLTVEIVPAASYNDFSAAASSMTIFQTCPLWLLNSSVDDDEYVRGEMTTVFSCKITHAGDDVVIGFARTLLRGSELTIVGLCAFVPRQCVGVSLLHAAVSHGVAHGARSVELYSAHEAVPFYTRLYPSSIVHSSMKWENARALLTTLAERATVCVVRADAFWFRTYLAYAQYINTGVYNAIVDESLTEAALEGSVEDAVYTLHQFHKDFVAFVHDNAIDIPELGAPRPEKRLRTMTAAEFGAPPRVYRRKFLSRARSSRKSSRTSSRKSSRKPSRRSSRRSSRKPC